MSETAAPPVSFADLRVPPEQVAPLRFTFLWPDEQRWEGHDFTVEVAHP